ncbi:MAG: hypothetical protein EBZ59_04365, partial [Planctomycetia bacterium]|nr:hypothetical protein [Planctomycetia bacterium]
QDGNTPHSAIRVGDLKLITFYEDDSVKLFDLSKDLGEREDLAAKMPAEAARLRQRLEKYLAEVGGQFPTPNPAFDPDTPASERPRRGGMKKPKPWKARAGNTGDEDA